MNLAKRDQNDHKITIIQNNNKVDYKNLLAKRKYEKLCAKDERKAFLKSFRKNHPLLDDISYYWHDDDDDCTYAINTFNLGVILVKESELKKKKLILEVEDFSGIDYDLQLHEISSIYKIPNKKISSKEREKTWFEKCICGGDDPMC